MFEDGRVVQVWTGRRPQLQQCLPVDDDPEEHSPFQDSARRQEDSAHEDSGMRFIALRISLHKLCTCLQPTAFSSRTESRAPMTVFHRHFHLQLLACWIWACLEMRFCASVF
jgi:hypothetical protein